MTTRTYHGTNYRLYLGSDTRQIDGHTHEPALDTCWYWEPADYVGDTLYSLAYETREDAAGQAEIAHDNGDWN